MNHEEYLDRRAELMKIRENSQISFDKTIITLSTGGLALSIAFIEKIGRPFDLITYWIIGLVWGLLSLTILANMLSYTFAIKNMEFKIGELNRQYKKQIDENIKVEEQPEETSNYKKWILFCNEICKWLFLLSVLLFSFYAFRIQTNNYNELTKEKIRMNTTNKNSGEKKDYGATEISKAISRPLSTEKAQTEVERAIAKPTENDNSTSNNNE